MLKGFKEFLLRGNVVDLAVAVVIGTAFTALVAKFTESFINPLLAAAGGSDSAKGWGHQIYANNDKTFLDVGTFINAIITFAITAAVIYFFVVMPMKHMQERRAVNKEPEPMAVPEDIALLREIRDSLRQQQP